MNEEIIKTALAILEKAFVSAERITDSWLNFLNYFYTVTIVPINAVLK